MATGKGRTRKRRPRDNPAQSRKFIEAAKKLGVLDGKAFEEAMRLVKRKPKGGSS
jgi:hypothetical protein